MPPRSLRLLRLFHRGVYGNPLDRIANLETAKEIDSNHDVVVNEASEISGGNLGRMFSGEFITPSSTATSEEPTNTGFTGAAMGGDGWTFNGTVWHFVAVAAGVLQAGISAAGQLLAGAGAVILGVNGITFNVSDFTQNLIRFMISSTQVGSIEAGEIGGLSGVAVIGTAKTSSYGGYATIESKDTSGNYRAFLYTAGASTTDGAPSKIIGGVLDSANRSLNGRFLPGHLSSPFNSAGVQFANTLWPMNGVSGVKELIQNENLTEQGGISRSLYYSATYYDFDGTDDHLRIADDAVMSITGDMSLFGWVWFDNTASGTESIMAKWRTTTNQSYRVSRNSSGYLVFEVSSDGSSVTTVTHTTVIPASKWTFWCARYQASTEMSLFVGLNGADLVEVSNTTSIPASVHDNVSNFVLGANQDGALTYTNFLNGRQTRVGTAVCTFNDEMIHRLYYPDLELFKIT